MSRIYKIADVVNPNTLHDIGFDRNISFINGYFLSGNLKPKSLCSISIQISNETDLSKISSFTVYEGNDGTIVNKNINSNDKRPIGCKIYYYDGESVPENSSGVFTDIGFYTTFSHVDARYTAVSGSNLSLTNHIYSNVYLRVKIRDTYYWSPWRRDSEFDEIIVSGNQLVADNFYIYLGRTSKTVDNEPWYFQLEDNNPLYFFDGRDLIPYVNYLASQKQDVLTAGTGISIQNNVISATGTTSGYEYYKINLSGCYGDDTATIDHSSNPELENMSRGYYKVTVQRNIYCDPKDSSKTNPFNVNFLLDYGTDNDGVLSHIASANVLVSP